MTELQRLKLRYPVAVIDYNRYITNTKILIRGSIYNKTPNI